MKKTTKNEYIRSSTIEGTMYNEFVRSTSMEQAKKNECMRSSTIDDLTLLPGLQLV
jgi:hypothetical protein